MSNVHNIVNFLLFFLGSISDLSMGEDCVDKSPYCNSKDCTIRPGYAREYCRKTCGNCTEICFNSHFVPCKEEQKPECDTMLKDYCPLLCGVCKSPKKKEKMKIQKVQIRTPIIMPASTMPTTTLTTTKTGTTDYVEVTETITKPSTATSSLPFPITTTAMQYVRPPIFSVPPRIIPPRAYNSIETAGEPLNIDVESEKAAPIDQGIPVISSQGGPSLMAHPGGGPLGGARQTQAQTRLQYPNEAVRSNIPDPVALNTQHLQMQYGGRGVTMRQTTEPFMPLIHNQSHYFPQQPPEPLSLLHNYPIPMSNQRPQMKVEAEQNQLNPIPAARYTPGVFQPTASLYGPSQSLSTGYHVRRKPATLSQYPGIPMTPSLYQQPRLWNYHEPQIEQDIQRRPNYHGANIEAEFPTRPSMTPFPPSPGYGYGPQMAVPNLIQLLVDSKIGANWFESLEVGLFDLLDKYNNILTTSAAEGCRDRDPSTCSRITEETCYSRPGFYLKLCPVTCKNCNGMQCYDSIKVDCEEVLRVGGCRLPTAGEYCPRTCRLCPMPPQLSEAVSPCKDELDNCDQLASSGVCEHSHSRETLRVYCARSCGFCKQPQYYMDDTNYFRTRNKVSKAKKSRRN